MAVYLPLEDPRQLAAARPPVRRGLFRVLTRVDTGNIGPFAVDTVNVKSSKSGLIRTVMESDTK